LNGRLWTGSVPPERTGYDSLSVKSHGIVVAVLPATMLLPLVKKKRSPLKAKPLRNPAQFLDEQINEFVEDKIGGPIWLAMIAVIITGLEWYRFFYPEKPARSFIHWRQY
jgi:hypothetical protein